MRRTQTAWALLTLCLVFLLPSLETNAEAEITYDTEVLLYYPAKNLTGLVEVKRSVKLPHSDTFSRVLINELLQEPEELIALPIYGKGARILDVEDSLEIVTLNIETVTSVNERWQALSALAIWKTFSENTKARGINILTDNGAVSYGGKALNTMRTCKTDDLDFESLMQTLLVNRIYTVYLPDKSGKYLLPVLEEDVYGEDDTEALLRLISTLQDPDGLCCTWPDGFDLSEGMSHTYRYTENNRRCLDLNYAQVSDAAIKISDAFAYTGMQQWQLIGSISMTLMTTVPDVERVTLKLMERQIQAVTDRAGFNLSFKNGEIARRNFSRAIGVRLVKLSYADEREGFELEPILMDSDELQGYKNLLAVCSEEIHEDDVLSVTASGSKAYVDLSGAYYARVQMYDDLQEKLAVYSIVNTLNLNIKVSGVRITVEGYPVESLAGRLNLKADLYPNYGLLLDE